MSCSPPALFGEGEQVRGWVGVQLLAKVNPPQEGWQMFMQTSLQEDKAYTFLGASVMWTEIFLALAIGNTVEKFSAIFYRPDLSYLTVST